MSPIPTADPVAPLPPASRDARTRSPGWLVLLAAIPLLLVANGRFSVWPAAWFLPVTLLVFTRGGRAWARLAATYLLLAAGFAFQFHGMVPIPGLGYAVFLILEGLFLVAPFVVDRLLHRRVPAWASTLVFPAAWTTTEFLYSLGPYGSWGSVAYSQYGNLPLLQVLSVTGLWGITFLIGWFAAALAEALEARATGHAHGQALRACLTVLAIVVLAGGVRLVAAPPRAETVCIASVSRPASIPDLDPQVFARLLAGRASDSDVEEVRRWGHAVDEGLLHAAEREARAGARVVFWGEANAIAFDDGEADLIERGSALAREQGIYLGMAVAVWNGGRTPPLENKLILIRPDGQVAWQFLKAHPVPGGEAAMSVRSDGRLRRIETPAGTMSAVICFDADFPRLLRQAGALGTDILLDPSNDWPAIDPWHTQMASFRAIEQGFNLVRHTSHGRSAAYDYQGRVLASMDDFQSADRVMVAQVPTRGVRTVYSRVGDLFAWLSAALLVALAGWSLRPGQR